MENKTKSKLTYSHIKIKKKSKVITWQGETFHRCLMEQQAELKYSLPVQRNANTQARRNNRAKAKDVVCNKVARSIVRAFPHLTDDDAVSTSMGAPGEDIKMSTATRNVLPLSIECKAEK